LLLDPDCYVAESPSTDEPPTGSRGNRKGLPLHKPTVGAGFTPALGIAINGQNNIPGSSTVDFFASKIMARNDALF